MKSIKLAIDTINNIKENMQNDLEAVNKMLSNLIDKQQLYGYEFTRYGGEENFYLALYPNSKFKEIKLGNNQNLELQFAQFKNFPEEVKVVAKELEQYISLIRDSKSLKEHFIDLHPFNDIVNKSSLKKLKHK
jgi:hypothetical protein